jgi:DNA repair protein RadA/Sms
VWRCQQCGTTAAKWQGSCPECGEIGTFVEEAEAAKAASASRAPSRKALRLDDISLTSEDRTPTGIPEFDRVLGGGLVRGSLVLLGGEPGIGKSTLLLQAAASLAATGAKVLYVCGEESPAQVKMRAERLGGCAGELALLPEVDVAVVEATALTERPDVLVVDSIQTALDPDLAGAPGSVGQVRSATGRLMRLAKDEGITTLIVGHVTKEGAIAGPRVLEHMVDTVLYFEGDRDHAFRVVRAVKNRFGSVSEIGVFEMGENGLVAVGSPSAALLAERPEGVPGSVVMATVEGSRPLLVEVQALVTPSYLAMPRRLATGVDLPRVLQVLAVLERRGGLRFGDQDVYVSVAGGVRVSEPAVDLPLALALASARRDVVPPARAVAFGELGLAGEVRPVPHVDARLKEAAQMGFATALMGGGRKHAVAGIDVRRLASVAEALAELA